MEQYKPAFQGALQTFLTLFGGLAIGLISGSLTFEFIPGSNVNDVQLGHAAIATIPALIGFLAGGAVWGVQMGRLAGMENQPRMAWAGTLGFGPITIVLAVGLGIAEPTLVDYFEQAGYPIHRVFTFLFVPSAFLIAGTSAYAIGKGMKKYSLALSLFWKIGFAAALTFFIINMIMEAAGWVVGAPGAAVRATMLTVLGAGNIGAALLAGGYLGWKLSK